MIDRARMALSSARFNRKPVITPSIVRCVDGAVWPRLLLLEDAIKLETVAIGDKLQA